ncbi:MAG: signal peptidase II [Bacteroidota bacterium]|nr:signal peptidase II [Bacteroidota bacterium]MDP4233446.1 signal peptidase II [Bacteroidota bacterium]MDP4242312.1 signal peptidase II [Bacteroidota bacterium]MDP4287068.1 signal peptidase II [Bacteroidota bacterium]
MAVLWITVIVVIFDQLTKLLVKGSPWSVLPFPGMRYGSSIPFIDDIVRITYIENAGIAFGISIPGFKVVFAVFSIVASIAILWYLKHNLERLRTSERVALALILGGAVGNLIDRVFYGVIYHEQSLFYGRVVDFVDFGYHRNWFPVFNVADSSVTIGVGLLILLLMRHKPSQPESIVAEGEPLPMESKPNEPEARESHSEAAESSAP